MKSLFVALATLLMSASVHAAEPGSKEWASCAVASDRAAADTWLAGAEPNWQTAPDAPELMLGLRLIALCSEIPADDVKVNRAPKWNKLRSALKRASADGSMKRSDVEAIFCRNYAGGLLYLDETVRRTATGDTIVYRQYFADYSGQAVKLPQDLRVMPPEDLAKSRKCFVIASTGALVAIEEDSNA